MGFSSKSAKCLEAGHLPLLPALEVSLSRLIIFKALIGSRAAKANEKLLTSSLFLWSSLSVAVHSIVRLW